MNKKRYFSDLLFLSPSFSLEEKQKIFQKYSQNDELLEKGIKIFEEELQKVVAEYVHYENTLQEMLADFLNNLNEMESKEQEKYQKLQKIFESNKLQEESEKSFQNSHFLNFL